MKLEFSRQILEKSSNIKFYENPSSGSRVVPGGQTDMTKLTVAFRSFVNAPKHRRDECNNANQLSGYDSFMKMTAAEMTKKYPTCHGNTKLNTVILFLSVY
jgi:hypothetical protein